MRLKTGRTPSARRCALTSASLRPAEHRKPRVGEAHALQAPEGAGRLGQARRARIFSSSVDDRLELLQEPAVDPAAS